MTDFPIEAHANVRAIASSLIREVANAGLGKRDVLPFWFGEPDEVTPQFIRDNNIRYFVDAHAGNDGFDSGTIVAAQLQRDFRLTQLAVFEKRIGNYDVLYRIDDPQATDPNALADSLRQQAASLAAQSIVLNPTLVWQDGVVPGWNANGRVALDPDGTGLPL